MPSPEKLRVVNYPEARHLGWVGGIDRAIEILRVYDKETDARLPRMHVVFGKYEGPIAAGPSGQGAPTTVR